MARTNTITEHIYEDFPNDHKMKGPTDNTMGTPSLSNGPTSLNKGHQFSDPDGYYKPPTSGDSDTDSSDFKNTGCVHRFQRAVAQCCRKNAKWIGRTVLFLLLAGYTVYFAFALRHDFYNARALLVLTCIAVFLIGYNLLKKYYGDKIYENIFKPLGKLFMAVWPYARWVVVPAIFIGIILFMIFDVVKDIRQLQSVSGLVFFILIIYLFSKHPDCVKWRPVVSGFVLQFTMGIIVLRWKPGFDAIKWASDQITKFISYSQEGAASVFGDPFFLFHPIVFVAMPMLIYLGAVLAVLYFFGITQTVAAKLGWFMQLTMGTTAIESLSVAGNIFLNGMDIMLMLRPYLERLTKSEFHTFLVGNHSTVAGFAFAIFILFGAPPEHLLSAAVMSAPAAIAVSKLSYPETEESCLKTQDDVQLERGQETNVIEAAANGAAVAGKTVVAVVVNLLAFLGILEFVNVTLSWLGGRVGYPELSFEIICSYLFIPIALVMGIEWDNMRTVAKLVGIKVFTSEFIAYEQLGRDIEAGLLTDRSAAIATYALCGFSGLATTAIAVGVWNAVCPAKTKDMASQLVRVVINANISCFMTASVAGILYNSDIRTARPPPSDAANAIGEILDLIPSYKDIFAILPEN